MTTEAEFIESSGKYAKGAGYVLNPDSKMVESIAKGIVRNEARYGFRYCPCRMVSGDKEQDRQLICPCVYHSDEIKSMGHCHCMLFWKGDKK